MLVVAIFAVAMATYRLLLFDIKRCAMAVGVFGPSFEHNGVVYDREVLHALFLADIPTTEYRIIAQPEWAESIEISGSTGWCPRRSDWFVVERDGVRNYLHLASAHDGLAMDVWIKEGVMYHQRNNGEQALARQLALSADLVSELQSKWVNLCSGYNMTGIAKP
jgi:hypothetical protein